MCVVPGVSSLESRYWGLEQLALGLRVGIASAAVRSSCARASASSVGPDSFSHYRQRLASGSGLGLAVDSEEMPCSNEPYIPPSSGVLRLQYDRFSW